MNTAVNEITVVCDSDGHARGKIVKIATYRHFPQGWGYLHRPRRDSSEGVDWWKWAKNLAADKRGWPQCKLCGALFWPPLDQSEIDWFAGRGKSHVSIKELNALRFS